MQEEQKKPIEPNKAEKPETAYYNIKGVSFKQDQITYGQAQELLKIPSIENIKNLKLDGSLTDMIAEIIRCDIAGELINLVLKINNKGFWTKIKNVFYSQKYNIDVSNPAKFLQLWEVQKVLQDFFYFNVVLIVSTAGSETISELVKMISQQQIYLTPSEQKKGGME